MFGIFKRQDVRSKIINEFEELIQNIRSAEPMKQGLVGRGFYDAKELFSKRYTEASYRAAPYAERLSYVEFIHKMEVELNKDSGPIRVCSIGFALFNRWLAAVALSDTKLQHRVEAEAAYFNQLADSFNK